MDFLFPCWTQDANLVTPFEIVETACYRINVDVQWNITYRQGLAK